MSQFVYLVYPLKYKNDNQNIYKIGKTNNIYRRMKEHNKPDVLCIFNVSDMNKIEKELITVFKYKYELVFGEEYFKGDINDMIFTFQEIISNFHNTIIGNAKIISKIGNETILNVKWKSEFSSSISNWKGNRPVDNERVEEIYKSYQNNQYIHKEIFLINNNGKLLCIDGNHRRNMFDFLLKTRPLTELFVNVIIFDETDDTKILQIFNNLNKSLQVPSLYTEETKLEKNEIERFCDMYSKKYKNFFMPSNKPKQPNTNKSIFTDFVTKNLEYHACDITELEKKMEMCNNSLRLQNENKKCETDNFYLFVKSNNFII